MERNFCASIRYIKHSQYNQIVLNHVGVPPSISVLLIRYLFHSSASLFSSLGSNGIGIRGLFVVISFFSLLINPTICLISSVAFYKILNINRQSVIIHISADIYFTSPYFCAMLSLLRLRISIILVKITGNLSLIVI